MNYVVSISLISAGLIPDLIEGMPFVPGVIITCGCFYLAAMVGTRVRQ